MLSPQNSFKEAACRGAGDDGHCCSQVRARSPGALTILVKELVMARDREELGLASVLSSSSPLATPEPGHGRAGQEGRVGAYRLEGTRRRGKEIEGPWPRSTGCPCVVGGQPPFSKHAGGSSLPGGSEPPVSSSAYLSTKLQSWGVGAGWGSVTKPGDPREPEHLPLKMRGVP